VDDPVSVVLVLVEEVGAHLKRGELAGLTLARAGGEADWIAVEELARAVLEEVRDCLDFAAGGGRVHPARWYELADRLRAIERAPHRGR
jgi:hypothetical protein